MAPWLCVARGNSLSKTTQSAALHSPVSSKLVSVEAHGASTMHVQPPQPSPLTPLTQLRLDIAKALKRKNVYEGPVLSGDEIMDASVVVAENVSLAEFVSIGEQFDSQCARLELIDGDMIARLETSEEHGSILSAVQEEFYNAGIGWASFQQKLNSSVFLPKGLGVPQADLAFCPRFRKFAGTASLNFCLLLTVVIVIHLK